MSYAEVRIWDIVRGFGKYMGKVTTDMSISLDGFVTGPNDHVDCPLGEGGEQLHQWIYDLESWRSRHGLPEGKLNVNAEVVEETFRNTGAVIMGRRMFEHGIRFWGDNPPFHVPVFVLTHTPREPLVKDGGTTFTFVTDGVQSALRQAMVAAAGQDVSIAGGANIVQQYLSAGLLDEIQIHLIPVLLDGGRRLFEHINTEHLTLENIRVIESPEVTHLKYRVVRE